VETYAKDVVDIKKGETVSALEKIDEGFLVKTEKGEEYKTKTVLVATGSHRRKITVPGAEEFENKGKVSHTVRAVTDLSLQTRTLWLSVEETQGLKQQLSFLHT